MEKFAKQKGLEYHYQKSEDSHVRFYLTNPIWEGKCWIGFTYEANRYHYGLCNNFNNYRLPDESRKILHERLKNLGVGSRKESNWWPFFAYSSNLTIDVWENDIIKSDNFINECKEKIEKILTAMEEVKL